MPLPYLAAELRQSEPDLYLLSLFAPADRREALWALFLFKREIAKTRSAVSDTTLGLIRLQWWRDEIGRLYQSRDMANCGKSPILSTLAKAVQDYDLPLEYFETLIYAHEFDLEDVAPANMDGLHHYADFTTTPLFKLALKIVGQDVDDASVRAAGVNFGLIYMIRNLPVTLAQRRCYLPEDLLRANDVTPQTVLDMDCRMQIVNILHSFKFLEMSKIKASAPFFKNILSFNKIQQKFLKKNDFDVFDQKTLAGPQLLALRILLDSAI